MLSFDGSPNYTKDNKSTNQWAELVAWEHTHIAENTHTRTLSGILKILIAVADTTLLTTVDDYNYYLLLLLLKYAFVYELIICICMNQSVMWQWLIGRPMDESTQSGWLGMTIKLWADSPMNGHRWWIGTISIRHEGDGRGNIGHQLSPCRIILRTSRG